jgi:chromosome segregation ATPase
MFKKLPLLKKGKSENAVDSRRPLTSGDGSRARNPSDSSLDRDPATEVAVARLIDIDPDSVEDTEKLRSELRKMSKALKDEREYTKSLKTQVDRLHLVNVQPSNQVQEELAVVKKMFEDTDQARFEATAELDQLKIKMAEMETRYLKSEEIARKAATLSTDLAQAKAESDEAKAQAVALGNQISILSDELVHRNEELVDLKNELESRPTTDDVTLLKKGMHTLQENFLKQALEKESELKEVKRKREELSEEWAKSAARIKALEAELGAKSMTSSEHVQRYV